MKTILKKPFIALIVAALACLIGHRISEDIRERKIRAAKQPGEVVKVTVSKLDGTVRFTTIGPDGEPVEWVQTPPSKRASYQQIDPDRVRQEWCDVTLQFAPPERTEYQRRFQN